MAAAPKTQRSLYTVAEYLAFERNAEERHEFIDGEICAMAGESPWHSLININLAGEVYLQLKGKSCAAYSPNMKVRSGEQIDPNRIKGLFSYADLMVVCGEAEFHDEVKDVMLNPKVIFEIASPTTKSYDRQEKFRRYRTHNPSLTDYVLIQQTQPLIEHFERQADESWRMVEVKGLGAELVIASIDCRLKLAELYDRVIFPASPAE